MVGKVDSVRAVLRMPMRIALWTCIMMIYDIML